MPVILCSPRISGSVLWRQSFVGWNSASYSCVVKILAFISGQWGRMGKLSGYNKVFLAGFSRAAGFSRVAGFSRGGRLTSQEALVCVLMISDSWYWCAWGTAKRGTRYTVHGAQHIWCTADGYIVTPTHWPISVPRDSAADSQCVMVRFRAGESHACSWRPQYRYPDADVPF